MTGLSKITSPVKRMLGITAPAVDKLHELNKNIDLMVQAGTEHLKRWMPLYRDGHNYLYNNQLLHQVAKDGWDRVQDNHIFPAAAQALSLLSLQRPKFLAHPREETDTDGGREKWEQALQWQFEEALDIPMLRLDAKLHGQSHGHWVVKLYWEPEAEWVEEEMRWKGEFRIRLLRPGSFVIGGDAKTVDEAQQTSFLYHVREVRVDWAKQRWPKHAQAIERAAGAKDAKAGSLDELLRIANMPKMSEAVAYDTGKLTGEHARPPGANPEGRLAGLLSYERSDRRSSVLQQRDGRELPGNVLLLEIFFRDVTRVRKTITLGPIPFEELVAGGRATVGEHGVYHDALTGEPFTEETRPMDEREVMVPKDPNGRRVLRVGEKEILEDDVWHLKKWPFVKGVNVQLPDTWHGMNAVEMSRGLQDLKNVIWANFGTYVKLHAQPVTLVEQGAIQGAPDNVNVSAQLQSRAGAIHKLLPGKMNAIKREAPANMASAIFDILEKAEEGLRDTLGMQNIALGKKAPGEQTATEAIELQTNSKIRSALENLNMDDFTLRLMKKVHMFLRHYWTPDEMVRVIGPERQVTMDTMALEAEFDLKMEVGTVLPFDEEREQVKADKILDVVGPTYLLEWLKAHGAKNAEDLAIAAWEYQAALAKQEQEQAAASSKSSSKKSGSGAGSAVKPASVSSGGK